MTGGTGFTTFSTQDHVPGGWNGEGNRQERHYARDGPNPALVREFGDLNLNGPSSSAAAVRRNGGLRALQIENDLVRALIAERRISFQATHDHLDEPVWQVRVKRLGVLGFLLNPLIHHLQRGFSGERHITGRHFVENQAIGVKIAPQVRGLAFHLLGGHVAGRAHKGAGTSHLHGALFKRSRQAEIGNV